MAPRASVEGISMLQDQYVAGRLDLEEFEARVAAVLRWRDEMVERGLLPWTYVWPWSPEADDWHRSRGAV